jgi:predicted TIM-barrel fold metal-dependent hydrolase
MRSSKVTLVVGLVFLALVPCRSASQPLVDHHQHLFSPVVAERSPGLAPITAADLVRMLDAAGITRAVVLSLGYQLGRGSELGPDEYDRVRAENDWTSREVARYADRLVGFCSFNPLKEYALAEIERCASDAGLKAGVKLHFGNSDVDLANARHIEQVRLVFAAANAKGMAIVLHMRPSIAMRRPYGAEQARTFIENILPAARDVPVQIAHLGGAGGYDDPAIDDAVAVFVEAIARRRPGVERVYFDASGVAGIGNWERKAQLIAQRIRELGLERVLFGSDGAVPGNSPAEAWAAFRKLPLSEAELEVIRTNTAPYLPQGPSTTRLGQ